MRVRPASSSECCERFPEISGGKLSRFAAAGPGHLQVVADWDRTLTTALTPDGRDHSTYAILYDGGYLGPEYQRRSESLYRAYRTSERSADLSQQDKQCRMEAWWTEQYDLMLASGFSSGTIDRAISDNQVRMRDGAVSLIRLLSRHRIPLLILSAGIKPFITRYLAAQGVLDENVCIVANDFAFDAKGLAVAYHRPLIHSLNKHRAGIVPADHFSAVARRPNLILLGDTLEDIRAAEGLDPACTLSYGFPESSTHPSISAYRAAYDVVIPDDGPMTPVLDLVRNITQTT
jgi:cytosolic 5'-nucleotidase 3